MKLHIHCSTCDHKYRVDTKHLGRTVKCKACGENILISRRNEAKPSVFPGSEVRNVTPSNSIPASKQGYNEEVEDESESDGVVYVTVVCLLALIALSLVSAGFYITNSHFSKFKKENSGWIVPPDKLKEIKPPKAFAVSIVDNAGTTYYFVAQDNSGTYAFECTYQDSYGEIVYLAAILISLLIIALATYTLIKQSSQATMFYCSMFGILISITVISVCAVKYYMVNDMMQQNSKSVAVLNISRLIDREEAKTPEQIRILALEHALFVEDDVFYSGMKIPNQIGDEKEEWILIAPRHCKANNLYLAIVMCPYRGNYQACLRLMQGSRINEMKQERAA